MHFRFVLKITVLVPFLSLPAPSVATVHWLIALVSQGPLVLRVGPWWPKIPLCHRPLGLPLSGQRPVTSTTCRAGRCALCRGHVWWQLRSTALTTALALAPSLTACFRWGLVRNPGLPLCWRLGQNLTLGCHADAGGQVLLKVLGAREGFVHQSQRMPGCCHPGWREFLALLQQVCLPHWGSGGGPRRRLWGGRRWPLACGGWYSG